METTAQARPRERQEHYQYELMTPATAAAWEDYVERHPRASIYHRAGWSGLIGDLFGHETHYWLARDCAGGVVGVLPLVRLRSRLFGDYLVSMPYFNYGGALGDSPVVEAGLMQAAAERAAELGIRHIEFRDTFSRGPGWPSRDDKVAMELALPKDPAELWKSIGSKLRAQIRRPQKAGAEAILGGAELVDEFYEVFSRNMRDLGTPVYPRGFFRAIAEAYPEQVRVVVVRYQGLPAAAGFLIGEGDRLEIPWASSLREHNRLAVNMLLYWHALESGIEAGYRVFDFGRSSVDAGTYRFKKQWGAQPSQLHWHYWLGDGGQLPNLTPNNPKYRLAVRAWQRLPLPVANWLGPRIVKNLP